MWWATALKSLNNNKLNWQLNKMTSKEKIKRVLYWLLATVLLFVVTVATVILYPQPLFANKIEYRQFNIYSNDKIGEEIKPILDSALLMLQKSELYDADYKVDIFFAYHLFLSTVDDKVLGNGPTVRAIDNNLVIQEQVDINKNLVYVAFISPVNWVLLTQ